MKRRTRESQSEAEEVEQQKIAKDSKKERKKTTSKIRSKKKRADKQTNGQTDTVDKYCRQIQVLQTDRQTDRQTKITTKKSAKKIIETINVVIVAYEARRQVGDYVFVGCCFDTIVL